MIDHMIMNSKKYWEGDMPCYVGKTFKSPTSPVDKWKTNTDSFYYVEPAHESLIPSGPILGQVENRDTNEIFLMGGVIDQYYLVKLTDLIQNGGVSHSLLTHVYHAFILARKELSMAIEKMLFNLKTWLPQAPGKWYKCEAGDGQGFAWLYQFDSKHSFWSTVYKAGGPNDADTLSKDVAARVDDENIVTDKNGFRSHRFVKITECPSRPDVVGEYLDLNELVKIGGGN